MKHNDTLSIAILVRRFPNIVQTYVLNHILSLKKAGYKTRIVAKRDAKQKEIHPRVINNNLLQDTLYINADKENLIKQILATPIFNTRFIATFIKTIFSNVWQQYGFSYSLKALLSLKLFAKSDIQIIHSHSLFCSYDYLFLKTCLNIPMTTTFHGLVPQNVEMLAPEKIKKVLDSGDAFFVNTKFAQAQLIGLGCSEDKIHIIPQGTDLSDFPFHAKKINDSKPITILSVGRLSAEKGFHIAIQAMAEVVKQHPSVRYHIVGSGIEEDKLLKLIEDNNLQEVVTIFGSISTEKLLQHYADADIFILPSIDFRDGSHTETQGVVLQEAQSSGVPIIASKTGGIPEIIIDNETGLLFDEENIEQLTYKIQSLITDDVLFEKLHTQGRKNVEDFYSSDVIGARLTDVYHTIIEREESTVKTQS